MEFKLGGVRVYLSFGFFSVLAAYLLLDQAGRGGGMLAAVAVHEAGHLAAMGMWGGRVTALGLYPFGVRLEKRGLLPLGRECAVYGGGVAANLLAAAHAEGIHTAIESCSFATREAVDMVLPHVDLALLDVKHMDSVTHEKLVGVPNEYILENIRHIHDDLHVPVILRMPTIPGYNDSIENLHAVGRFAASLGPDVSVNLLPFHKLGESKNESLGHPHSLGIEPPSDQEMEAYRDIVASHGVQVKIGG